MFSCHGDSEETKSFTSCSHFAQFVVCKARRSHTDGTHMSFWLLLGSLLAPEPESPCPSGDDSVGNATNTLAASEETLETLLMTIDPEFQVFRREPKTTHPWLRGATVCPRL